MGARLGRTLTHADSGTQVAVISENLAREYWKDPQLAVGRRIRNSPDNPWRTIVGVVGDERDDGLARPAPTTVYWPLLIEKLWTPELRVQRSMTYLVRSERPKSTTLVKEVQQAVWSVNASLPVANVRSRSMRCLSFGL